MSAVSSAQTVEPKGHDGAEAAFSDDLPSNAPTEHRPQVGIILCVIPTTVIITH